MTEHWRAVVGFDHYEVSDAGRVRSWRRQAKGGLRSEPRLRQLITDKDGYNRVALERGDGRQKSCMVHDLVLEAFVGPRPEGMQCRHMDGSKTNNVPSNLQWGTPLENSRDKATHGTQCRGRAIYKAVLDEDRVRSIRRDTGMLREIAERHGLPISTVGHVRSRRTWAWVEDEKGTPRWPS